MSLLLFISIRDIFLVILGSTNLSMATISDNMSWVLSLNCYGGFKFPQLLSKTQMVRKIMCCFLVKTIFVGKDFLHALQIFEAQWPYFDKNNGCWEVRVFGTQATKRCAI